MARWSYGPREAIIGLKKRALTWPYEEIPPRRRRRVGAEGELWERDREPFEGARVLDDLDRVGGDARDAAAVVARYAVVRVALRAEAGLAAWSVFEECAAAAEYLAGDHSLSQEECAALADVLRQVMRRDTVALVAAMMEAGSLAARGTHAAGAFALYLAAYRVALAHAWSEAASRAARAVAVLAEEGGGRRSMRRWTRRANALERRAAKEAAARAAAEREASAGGASAGEAAAPEAGSGNRANR